MQAAVYRAYGPPEVVGIEEVAPPVAAAGGVLVRVHATSVTTADWRLRASAFPGITWLPGRLMTGLRRPRKPILGMEFAGRIAALGPGAGRFEVGEAVFGFAGGGGHAEYLAMPESGAIARVPAGLDLAEAASVPFGALSALVFLRDFARLRSGERVLVVGASGGVGVWAVQIARHLGARVTGVASGGNRRLVLDLGAERAIDYRAGPLTGPGDVYDVVLDTIGVTSYADCRESLAPGGRFVPLNIGLRELADAARARLTGGPRVVLGISGDTREDLEQVAAWLEEGAIRPVVDRRYPFERIRDAYRDVESRHRSGSVLVILGGAA